MGRFRRIGLGVALQLCIATAGEAESARDLLDRAKRLDDGVRHWTDRDQRMVLKIVDATGHERQREVRLLTRRDGNREQKTVAFIGAPPDMRGVAFLQWEHAGRAAEQWLYLPEFKRTRQIATGLRDESFVGSDLSYRDLEIIGRLLEWDETEAPSRLDGEESLDETVCHRVILKPTAEQPTYAAIVVWLDKEKLLPRRLHLAGADGKIVKRIHFRDWHDVGNVPTAHHVEVWNLNRSSVTTVEIQQVGYDQGLDDELFTQRQLERAAP